MTPARARECASPEPYSARLRSCSKIPPTVGRSVCRSSCTTCATHATLLLVDGVPLKVVSERLGHASTTITLTGYQHVLPGMGRKLPTALVPAGGPSGNEVSRGYHGMPVGPDTRTPRAPDLWEHRGAAVSEGRHVTYAHASDDHGTLSGACRSVQPSWARTRTRTPCSSPPTDSAGANRIGAVPVT